VGRVERRALAVVVGFFAVAMAILAIDRRRWLAFWLAACARLLVQADGYTVAIRQEGRTILRR
jgi:hypothetical protein